MKTKSLLILGVTIALPVLASFAPLAWDASPSVGVNNYIVKISTNAPVLIDKATGAETTNATNSRLEIKDPFLYVATASLTATLRTLPVGRYWATVAAADASGVLSDDSNILQLEVPAPAGNFRTISIQGSVNLTNWASLGFFRLEIQPTNAP